MMSDRNICKGAKLLPEKPMKSTVSSIIRRIHVAGAMLATSPGRHRKDKFRCIPSLHLPSSNGVLSVAPKNHWTHSAATGHAATEYSSTASRVHVASPKRVTFLDHRASHKQHCRDSSSVAPARAFRSLTGSTGTGRGLTVSRINADRASGVRDASTGKVIQKNTGRTTSIIASTFSDALLNGNERTVSGIESLPSGIPNCIRTKSRRTAMPIVIVAKPTMQSGGKKTNTLDAIMSVSTARGIQKNIGKERAEDGLMCERHRLKKSRIRPSWNEMDTPVTSVEMR